MEATRKISKRREMANEGVLHSQFTQNGWFVKIKPAFSIERVVFSFVQKGTNGSGFDIYMDMDVFRIWMEDVRSGAFARTIAAEKAAGEKYPKAYKYTTGESAEKSVGFGVTTGSSFCVINGKTFKDGKNVYANIPVDLTWMRVLAMYFFGVAEEKYKELFAATLNGSNAYRANIAEVTESDAAPSGQNPQAEAPVMAEQPVKTDDEPIAVGFMPSYSAEATASPVKKSVEEKVYSVKAVGDVITSPKGSYSVPVVTADNINLELVILQERLGKYDQPTQKKFASAISAKTPVRFKGLIAENGKLYFSSIA